MMIGKEKSRHASRHTEELSLEGLAKQLHTLDNAKSPEALETARHLQANQSGREMQSSI